MDQTAVETYLTTIRSLGKAEMRPCGLVSDAFLPLDAHKVGVAHLFLRPRFLLADPTGGGKTPQALVAFGYLREKDPSLKLLVVTTKGAQFQWKTSVERFLPGFRAEVLGHDARTRARLSPTVRKRGYLCDWTSADVLITTYATLALDESEILTHFDRYILVLDEVHKVKSHKQDKLFPAALHVSQKARCCWGLSATPMQNDRLDELYSVMEVVRPGTFGDWRQFRRLYHILRLVKPKWKPKPGKPVRPFYEIIGYQNQDHLQAVIQPFYLRRPLEVIQAGLPPVTYRREDVFLDAKQRKAYDTLWKGQWPGATEKLQKIQVLTRAQQLLAWPEIVGYRVPNAYLDALVALLKGEFVDQKVLVYSKFAEVVKKLGPALQAEGITHSRVIGEDSAQAREVARLSFQSDPKVKVMLLTDAGGEALDLQAASAVIFYDLPWSYGGFQQVIGRARRIGSAHANVLAVLLGAPQTIADTIIEILTRKEQTIRNIIQQGNTQTDSTLSTNLHTTHLTELLKELEESQSDSLPLTL